MAKWSAGSSLVFEWRNIVQGQFGHFCRNAFRWMGLRTCSKSTMVRFFGALAQTWRSRAVCDISESSREAVVSARTRPNLNAFAKDSGSARGFIERRRRLGAAAPAGGCPNGAAHRGLTRGLTGALMAQELFWPALRRAKLSWLWSAPTPRLPSAIEPLRSTLLLAGCMRSSSAPRPNTQIAAECVTDAASN